MSSASIADWTQRCVMSSVTQDPNDKSGYNIELHVFLENQYKRVTQIELWECPVSKLGAFLKLLGYAHQGIVATLENGRQFLVHKLQAANKAKNNAEFKGIPVVTDKECMKEGWIRVKAKAVKSATLYDYVKKCGFSYNMLTDNCMHAVERMWDELI